MGVDFWPCSEGNFLTGVRCNALAGPKHKSNICDTWVVQLLACTFIQQSQRKYEMLRGGGALKHHLYGVLANHEQVERGS